MERWKNIAVSTSPAIGAHCFVRLKKEAVCDLKCSALIVNYIHKKYVRTYFQTSSPPDARERRREVTLTFLT